MPFNIVKLSPQPATGKGKVSDGPFQGHEAAAPLTSHIQQVNTSSTDLSTARKNNSTGILSRIKAQWSSGSRPPSREDSDDEEETELTEILSYGKDLRLQTETLYAAQDQPPPPQEWKGSFLIRSLIGVGIIPDAGGLMRYYAERKSSGGQAANATTPYSGMPSLQPLISETSSRGAPEEPFGIYALPQNGTQDVIKCRRKHLDEHEQRPVSLTRSVTDVNIVANRKIKTWLRHQGLLNSGKVNKETVLCAVAAYIFDQENPISGNAEKSETVARIILDADNLYGGKEHEGLSTAQAESVVRQWLFNMILRMPPDQYIADKLPADDNHAFYTVRDIHHLLSLTQLGQNHSLHPAHFTPSQREAFNAMWHSLLNAEMPFLQFSGDEILNMEMNSDDFASLYVGSRFLNGLSVKTLTPEDAMQTGEKLWELATSAEGVTEDKLVYLSTPALFAVASDASERKKKHKTDRITAMNKDLDDRNRRRLNAIQKDIGQKYNSYLSATKAWLSKGKLADDMISRCDRLPPTLPDLADGIRTPVMRREKDEAAAKQRYLKGWGKPCKVPFYDCVEGIVNHDSEQAVPACLMDAVSLIPVLSEAASLSGKFGMSFSRGLMQGIFAAGKKDMLSVGKYVLNAVALPTTKELAWLGKTMVSAADPGFELAGSIGRISAQKLISLMSKDKKTASLAKRLVGQMVLARLPQVPSVTPVMASLPDQEIQVPVTSIGQTGGREVYVRVNPETGELSGERFLLNQQDTFRKRLQRITTTGLSGRGAVNAGRAWAPQVGSYKSLALTEITDERLFDAARRELVRGNLPINRRYLSRSLRTEAAMNLYCLATEDFDFSGYSLKGWDFNRSSISLGYQTSVIRTIKNCQLSGADFDFCHLRGIEFVNTEFSNCNLKKLDLEVVAFRDSDLSNLNFKISELVRMDIISSNLRGIHFDRSTMGRLNIINSDLSGSLMNGCYLHGVNFAGTNLSGAKLKLKEFSNCIFSIPVGTYPTFYANPESRIGPAIADDMTEIVLDLRDSPDKPLSEQAFDWHFYHQGNDRSVLATIAAMPDSFNLIKISLAEQVIDYINEVKFPISHVYRDLIRNLSGEDLLQSVKVKKFLENIAMKKIQKYNREIIPEMSSDGLKLFASLFERGMIDPTLPEYNMAFNQLLNQMNMMCSQGDIVLGAKSIALYEKIIDREKDFINSDEVAGIFGDMHGDHRFIDGSELNRILSGYEMEGEKIRLLMSSVNLSHMLWDPDFNQWHNIYLFRGNKNIPLPNIDLDKLYSEIFPVFYANYVRSTANKKMIGFFERIGLHDNLKTAFADIITKNTVAVKFVEPDKQQQLAAVFNPHMLFDDAQTPALTQENYLSITEYFNLENADNSRKARTLFSLSVLFTRYSSSGRLGTENNSPLVLRYYAYALMRKAWELDNTIIREADFREWGNKLLGRDGAFTCTSVLADYQSRVALERFPNIYKSIVPANLIM